MPFLFPVDTSIGSAARREDPPGGQHEGTASLAYQEYSFIAKGSAISACIAPEYPHNTREDPRPRNIADQ